MHAHSIPRSWRRWRTLSVLLAASATLCLSLLAAAAYTLYSVLRYKDLERDALLVLAQWQTMDSLSNDILLKRVSLSDGGASETVSAWERQTLEFSLSLAKFNDHRALAPLGPSIVSDVEGAVGVWVLAQEGLLTAQRSLRSMIRSGLASKVMVNGFLQTSYGMRREGLLTGEEVVTIQDLVSSLAVLDSATTQFDQRLRAVVDRVSWASDRRIRGIAVMSVLFALAVAALVLSAALALMNYRSAERRRRGQSDRLRRDYLRVLFETCAQEERTEAEAILKELGVTAVFLPRQVLCLFRFDRSERAGMGPEELVPFLEAALGDLPQGDVPQVPPEWFPLEDGVTAVLVDGGDGGDSARALALELQTRARDAGLSVSTAVGEPFGPGEDRSSLLRSLLTLFAYRYSQGPGSALFARDPPRPPEGDFEYPAKTEELCVRRLLEGNSEEAARYLESVIDLAKPYPPTVLRSVVARLSSALFSAVERLERAGGVSLPAAAVDRLAEIVLLDNVAEALRRFRLLLAEIEVLQRAGEGEGRRAELVERTDALIGALYADPDLSLDRLADRLGLSSGYLGRMYRRAAGKSVADAITDRRLAAAESALTAGLHTVEAVAAEVGITNPGSFYRLFKGRYGLTPAEFRERSRSLPPESTTPRAG